MNNTKKNLEKKKTENKKAEQKQKENIISLRKYLGGEMLNT